MLRGVRPLKVSNGGRLVPTTTDQCYGHIPVQGIYTICAYTEIVGSKFTEATI